MNTRLFATRVVQDLEASLGIRFDGDQFRSMVTKAIVGHQRISRAGNTDIWGASARTLDTNTQGRHRPLTSSDDNPDDGHPPYEYSRPLEGEERVARTTGQAMAKSADDDGGMGQDDPTAFDDGSLPAWVKENPENDPDTQYPPYAPAQKSDPSTNRPVKLEVSDTFEDAPGVEAHGPSRLPRVRADADTDTRGAPVNLRVGAADAVAMGQLHRSMFRRTVRDKAYDLAVVHRGPDGKLELIEESVS